MSRTPLTGEPCYIELFTPDTDAAAAFYGPLFGWTAGESSPEFGGYRMFLKDDVPVAGLMANDGTSGSPNAWSVYLSTDDLDATLTRTTAAGGRVLAGPMQIGDLGSMAMVLDPAGAVVGAWQADTFSGTGVIAEPGGPGWFETLSKDFARSAAFYTDVFGWDLTKVSDTEEFRYSTLGSDDDARAGIMDAAGFLDEQPSYWRPYLMVEDTDAAVEQALGLGGTVEMAAQDTPHGRLAVLVDPAGVPFSAMGPVTDDV